MELIQFRRRTRCPQRQTARNQAGQLTGTGRDSTDHGSRADRHARYCRGARAPRPDDPARLRRRDRKENSRMAEQSGERRFTAEVGEELISLMLPGMDPELARLMLSRDARSAAGGRADHE